MTDFAHDDDDGQGLRHYLAVVSRRRWIVAGVFVLALVAAILFTLRQPSEYKAQTTIVVGQSGVPRPAAERQRDPAVLGRP